MALSGGLPREGSYDVLVSLPADAMLYVISLGRSLRHYHNGGYCDVRGAWSKQHTPTSSLCVMFCVISATFVMTTRY